MDKRHQLSILDQWASNAKQVSRSTNAFKKLTSGSTGSHSTNLAVALTKLAPRADSPVNRFGG